MNSEVRQIVCAALAKGRLMRNAQKAYFTLRTGQAKPKQGVLPL